MPKYKELQKKIKELTNALADHKKVEQSLKDSKFNLDVSNKILTSVLENTHIKVVLLDSQFNFIWVNRAYAETCGYEPDFFQGKNHFDLYPHQENQKIFQKVVETGIPFFVAAKPFEFPDQPARGVTYWDWSLIPIMDECGNVNALVFTLADVTDAKKIEQERIKWENRRQLIQKAHSLNQMAGAIAHRFNNILTALIGNLEIAIEDLRSEGKTVQNLNDAIKIAYKAAEISTQMLTYVGQSFEGQSSIDLSAFCRRALLELKKEVNSNITLDIQLPSTELFIDGNEKQIHEALKNLVFNAAEAIGPASGTIGIRLTTCSGCIHE